jgi:hypothetical protein
MTQNQVEKEISIIKNMIEKTRRETAESGLLFIIPGIFLIFAIVVIRILESQRLDNWVLPALFIAMGLTAIISMYIGFKGDKTEKVTSYPKTLFANLWCACIVPFILIGVVFPLTHVLEWNVLPLFSFLILGIAIYMTGAIYELRLVQCCGAIFWIGACLLAYIEGPIRMVIVISVLFLGYVLPGYILNRTYKNRSQKDEL